MDQVTLQDRSSSIRFSKSAVFSYNRVETLNMADFWRVGVYGYWINPSSKLSIPVHSTYGHNEEAERFLVRCLPSNIGAVYPELGLPPKIPSAIKYFSDPDTEKAVLTYAYGVMFGCGFVRIQTTMSSSGMTDLRLHGTKRNVAGMVDVVLKTISPNTAVYLSVAVDLISLAARVIPFGTGHGVAMDYNMVDHGWVRNLTDSASVTKLFSLVGGGKR